MAVFFFLDDKAFLDPNAFVLCEEKTFSFCLQKVNALLSIALRRFSRFLKIGYWVRYRAPPLRTMVETKGCISTVGCILLVYLAS